MKTDEERQVLIAIFDILFDRHLITEDEYHRLKLLVKMEENQR